MSDKTGPFQSALFLSYLASILCVAGSRFTMLCFQIVVVVVFFTLLWLSFATVTFFFSILDQWSRRWLA